jgi:hypothetical protein
MIGYGMLLLATNELLVGTGHRRSAQQCNRRIGVLHENTSDQPDKGCAWQILWEATCENGP